MTQKEMRKKSMQIVKTEVYPCSREMQEFSKRRCGYIVELTDGKIIRLYKPRKHVPYDFTEIMDKITRLTLCLEGFCRCKTFVQYFTSSDDCDLVQEVTYSGVEPEWMKEKAARGQERNSEDIQRIIDGYKYLLMKYKVGGKKKRK